MELKVAERQAVLLSRIRSKEAGQEVVYVGLRDSYNKLVKPASWQTFFGYITKGIKAGELLSFPCYTCKALSPGPESEGGGGGYNSGQHLMES